MGEMEWILLAAVVYLAVSLMIYILIHVIFRGKNRQVVREEDKKHGIYKFIHVNTVAPFGTFRTKIRKWKKTAL